MKTAHGPTIHGLSQVCSLNFGGEPIITGRPVQEIGPTDLSAIGVDLNLTGFDPQEIASDSVIVAEV